MKEAKISVGMACTICGAPTDRIFQKHRYWIRECGTCHHRCAEVNPSDYHVERIYGDHYFNDGEAGYPDYMIEAEILISHGRHYARLLERYMQPGTILDVGAAAGFILSGFEKCGWIGTGIEPNPSMAEYARNNLELNVMTKTLEQFQSNDSYDLICMIQVIAHFLNPREALQVAAKVTRPSGYWLIETWNKESWTARVFGKSWHEYSPPSVLHWFSIDGLHELTSAFGFNKIAWGRPSKRIHPIHAKTLARYIFKDSALGRLLIRLINIIPDSLPIPYPGDDIFWVLYQKS